MTAVALSHSPSESSPLHPSAGGGVVGVLGGMGPLATIDFLHKMLRATSAGHDQDHVPVLAASIPQIPDRTAAYRGEGESPLPAMLAVGQRLVAGGAGLIVMPCNTAHLWFDPLQQGLQRPMLHLVDAALAEVRQRHRGTEAVRVGILATDATLASGLYMNRRPPEPGGDLQGPDLQWVLPTAVEMVAHVMPGIAAVKAGALTDGRSHLRAAAQALVQRGAQALVLACTEIPLVLGEGELDVSMIDATAALARAAVAWSQSLRVFHMPST